jgi:cytoskeleton protein RodZ
VSSNCDQSIKLAEIGEQLKRQREEKAIPLTQVTSQTLISERHLKAIEEGNLSSLPEPIYVQGFIRKYGNAVGLDGLAEEFPVNREPIDTQTRSKASSAELRPLHLYALYIAVITGAISTLAVLFNPARTARIDDRNTNISEIAQLEDQANQSAEQNTANSTTDVVVDPVDPNASAVNESTATAEAQTSQSEQRSNQANQTRQDVASTPTNQPEQTEINNNQVTPDSRSNPAIANPNLTNTNNSFGSLNQWVEQMAASSRFDFNSNKPVNIGLQMNGQSWVRVVADGTTVYEGVMSEGAKQVWSADSDIVVRAGNAGAVTVVYNNEPAKTMGSEGEVVEWIFDKEYGADYSYSSPEKNYANQYTYNYTQGDWLR